MIDLHRHSEFSQFDGFGKAENLALIAKEKGHTSFSVSEHGNVNGWIKHYKASKEAELKPVLGVECYYQPKFDKEAQTYHLCLFAKNSKGYRNINRILYHANRDNYYYRARVTDELLERYSEGVICSTACVTSFFSQMVLAKDKRALCSKMERFKAMFEDDLYIEIMPYKIDSEGTQEKVNRALIKLSKKFDIPCILTSDSHYGNKSDFDTYVKMHEIAKHKIDVYNTYKERYMPTEKEIVDRFIEMHSKDFVSKESCKHFVRKMIKNLEEIEEKVDGEIIDKIESKQISFGVKNPDKLLKQKILEGMKSRGKCSPEYKKRVKKEFEVIKENNFADYFLIVQDYVNWAKKSGIAVGPGRGSVCNSVVAYMLGITDVDSIKYDLNFERFLRMDKKKMPDIDLDFEIDRRAEVIDYISNKYKGRTAQIASYGLYKVDNALNDLFKVCGVFDKKEQAEIKKFVKSNIDQKGEFHCSREKEHIYNMQYDDILKHFRKLYNKVRFIGTHAAGVAITGTNILDYVAIERRGGVLSCSYDLDDLEYIGVLKFDILGLKTMSEIKELEELTKDKCDESWLDDRKIYFNFRKGNTDGIFQFESDSVKEMLGNIHCDSFDDLRACNAMNRPGPLQLGMPEQYKQNKYDLDSAKHFLFYKQTKDTFGTIIYQEQIMRICQEVAGMSGDMADKMLKLVKDNESRIKLLDGKSGVEKDVKKAFIEGASKKIPKKDAEDMFEKISVYSFNKGHATGYSIIGAYLMHFKLYHPEYFWLVKLKYASKQNIDKYKAEAVVNGSIILIPHVNGTAEFSVSKRFGSECLQEGLCNIDGIGLKVAQAIEEERLKHGDYESYFDVTVRLPKRVANNKVLNALEKAGALEFNESTYLKRVEKYNMALSGRVNRKR